MEMKIVNPALGEITYDSNSVVTFPEGMLGMPLFKKFVVIQAQNLHPFYRLQCVDEPRISFLVVDPAVYEPTYRSYLESKDPDEELLGKHDAVVLLAVCRVVDQGADIQANLQAPVIINHKEMTGRQIVLIDSPFKVRHSLKDLPTKKEAK